MLNLDTLVVLAEIITVKFAPLKFISNTGEAVGSVALKTDARLASEHTVAAVPVHIEPYPSVCGHQ